MIFIFCPALSNHLTSVIQMEQSYCQSFGLTSLFLLLFLYGTNHVQRHLHLLPQITFLFSFDLVEDQLVIVLFLQLNPSLLFQNGWPFEILRHVGFGNRASGFSGLEEVSKLFLPYAIFDLISTPSREVSGNLFPTIAQPDVTLFEDLIFFPCPFSLSEVGI